MIDLHTHSYYSDGVYSPKKLAEKAKEIGISLVSLCDHNGIDGVEEFLTAGRKLGLNVVPGVEIYTFYRKQRDDRGGADKHFHLLGYDFDIKNKQLLKGLKKLQDDHIPQIKKTIKTLQEDNWNIQEKHVFADIATYIGIAKIANVLKKNPENWKRIKKDFNWYKGKIIPITQIISKYFYKTKNSIYSESEISIEAAIDLIKQAGGKTVLAHPGKQISWSEDYIVEELKQLGLDGLEAISSHHSWQEIEHWQIAAKELDLKITVGSDFHGYVPEEWDFLVRGPWDYFGVDKSNFSLF